LELAKKNKEFNLFFLKAFEKIILDILTIFDSLALCDIILTFCSRNTCSPKILVTFKIIDPTVPKIEIPSLCTTQD